MNGIKYIFDTNALIAFFQGNQRLSAFRIQNNKIVLSVITVIEFLAFKELSEKDKELFFEFINEAEVINLTVDDVQLISKISLIRSSYNIKLPHAIIAASCIHHNAILLTNDVHFNNITTLQTQTF